MAGSRDWRIIGQVEVQAHDVMVILPPCCGGTGNSLYNLHKL